MRTDLLLAILTGFLLSFAYPPYNLGLLAYWALIPLFYLLEEKRMAPAFRWGYLTGFFVIVGGVNVLVLSDILSLTLAIFIHPFYFALYSVLHVLLREKIGQRYLIAIPFLWVALEFVKGLNHFGFSSLNLGYTHPQYVLLLGDAASVAPYLLSFWICCLNVLIYAMLQNLQNRRKVAYLLLTAIVLLVIPLSCGYRTLEIPDVFDQVVTFCRKLGAV